jgi:hypothetical protein
MWTDIIGISGSVLASCLLCIGGQFVVLAIYRRLFGILYRNVSAEYAEPISFWVTMVLCFSLTGYIVVLALS